MGQKHKNLLKKRMEEQEEKERMFYKGTQKSEPVDYIDNMGETKFSDLDHVMKKVQNLHHIHYEDFIHRDFHPGNILIGANTNN
ncbi:17634_t:CDS:2 [Entrophospora sp. SA101]|nr:17634_t:CDS:2 [Entrophospora sp. SA101]